jgi:hypothetical protein
MLNDETDPSAKPTRKKKRAMALINASIAQGTQNFKRVSSSTTPRSREDLRADRAGPSTSSAGQKNTPSMSVKQANRYWISGMGASNCHNSFSFSSTKVVVLLRTLPIHVT